MHKWLTNSSYIIKTAKQVSNIMAIQFWTINVWWHYKLFHWLIHCLSQLLFNNKETFSMTHCLSQLTHLLYSSFEGGNYSAEILVPLTANYVAAQWSAREEIYTFLKAKPAAFMSDTCLPVLIIEPKFA